MKDPEQIGLRAALRVAGIYAVVASVWILLSDLAVSRIVSAVGIGPEWFTYISVAKGWAFVVVTSSLLYALVKWDTMRIFYTEARLRFLFNCVTDSIYMFRVTPDGAPGKIIDVNEAAVRRLGYTRDELVRLTPLDLMKPELQDTVGEIAAMVGRRGQATFETIQVAKDGREIPVEVNARAIQLGKSHVVISIVRDITERKRMEEARQEAAVAAERDKQRFYKETILAVTQGKFTLGDPEEAREWVQEPELTIVVSDPTMMSAARHSILDYTRCAGLSEEASQEFLLAVGEALGNAVKHATGAEIRAGTRDEAVWVAVNDHGSGIDTFAIPKVALLSGFTTKHSMGLGYTMILEVSDRVRLATGPSGTTVVMEKRVAMSEDVDQRIACFGGID